jgi:hypothetical protein
MAIDGTYGFVYCGVNGLGVGVFTVKEGEVRGKDYAGVRYSGIAKENSDGTVALMISQEVPPGVELAQGTAAQELPHTRHFDTLLPPDFGDGKPQEISSPPGLVTVMIKRIRDEFAPAAVQGVTEQTAQRLAVAAATENNLDK